MRYRIRKDEKNAKRAIVEDVIEAGERLSDGYTIRYGVNVNESVPTALLSRRLIGELNNIYDIKFEDGAYVMSHLYVWADGSEIETDILEVDSKLGGFKLVLDILVKKFRKKSLEHKGKVIQKRLKTADEDDMFKKCFLLIQEYSKNSCLPEISEQEALEVYAWLYSHSEELMNSPIALEKKQKQEYDETYSYVKPTLAMCVLIEFFFLLTGSYLFGIIFALYEGVSYKQIFNRARILRNAYNYETFHGFMATLEDKIDMERFKEMIAQNERDSIGFVDIVEKDLEFIRENREYAGFESEFTALIEDYSKEYCRAIDADEEIDAVGFVEQILDAEERMYASNKRCGLLHKQPGVDVQHLYDILDYVEWNKEEVLKDEFLRNVISSMKGIIEHPYVGCECELVDMIRVATDYAMAVSVGDEEELATTIHEDRAYLDAVFNRGVEKLKMASSAEVRMKRVMDDEMRREQTMGEPGLAKGNENQASPNGGKRISFKQS